MTDAHCHVSCGDSSVRELLIGRDFFGIHPWETLPDPTPTLIDPTPTLIDSTTTLVDPNLQEHLASLRSKLLANPAAGVGEIGFDRLKVRDIPPLMREVFEAQLALALELRRPVVLHGAKCWGRVVEAIKVQSAFAAKPLVPLRGKAALVQGVEAPGTRFLFHGFSRSDGLIPEIVKLNGFISVGPAVLNDHAVNYRALVKKIPLDRLLVETDRTSSLGSPSIFDVLTKTADIRNLPAAELERITDENADRFLGVV